MLEWARLVSEGAKTVNRSRLARIILALAVLCPATARAAEEDELTLVTTQVQDGQYREAVQRCGRLLDPASPVCPSTPGLSPQGCRVTEPAVILRVRGQYAIALQALDQTDSAKEQFRAILKDNPTFSPSPAVYPSKAVALFNEVKQETEAAKIAEAAAKQKQLEALKEAQRKYDAYVATLERLAKEETYVVERNRFFAAMPFGVGQFYNGDVALGVVFASLEVTAGVVGIATGYAHVDLIKQKVASSLDENGEPQDVSTSAGDQVLNNAALNDELLALQIANNVSMGELGLAIVVGLIEGQANFESGSKRTVPRQLPPKPPKPDAPAVGLTGVPGAPDATGLGLRVAF